MTAGNTAEAHKQHHDTWAFMYECDECRRIEEGFTTQAEKLRFALDDLGEAFRTSWVGRMYERLNRPLWRKP